MEFKMKGICLILSVIVIQALIKEEAKEEHLFLKANEEASFTSSSGLYQPTSRADSIKASTIREIKDNEPIPDLDFNVQKAYGFYYNLKSFDLVEKAGLFLFFNKAADLSNEIFFFVSKLHHIPVDEKDLDQYLPQETDESDFPIVKDRSQYVSMLFEKFKPEPDPSTASVVFFLIKLNRATTSSKARIISKRQAASLEITSAQGTLNIPLQSIPYIVKVHNAYKDNLLLYSDNAFNVYRKLGIDLEIECIHRNVYLSYSSTYFIFVFYDVAPSHPSAELGYSENEYYYNQIDYDKTNMGLGVNFAYFKSKELTLLSFASIAEKKDKWIYFKKVIGNAQALSYSSFDIIKGSESLFIPQTNYPITEPISLTSNYYVLRVLTQYDAYYEVDLVEKMSPIKIDCQGVQSVVHFLDKGSHEISLSNAKRRHIIVTLVQRKAIAPESDSIAIKMDGKRQVINDANRAVKFVDLVATTMALDCKYQQAVLEFKFNSNEDYREAKADGSEQTYQYIYYKFLEDAHSVRFTSTKKFTFNIGMGNKEFITLHRPNSPAVFDFRETRNPFNTNEPLAQGDSIYISFEHQPEITYSLFAEKEKREYDFLPIKVTNAITNAGYSLYSNKAVEVTALIFYVLQCKPDIEYSISLSYRGESVEKRLSKKRWEIFAFRNDYVSFDLLPSSPGTNSYTLSYAYFKENEYKYLDILKERQQFSFTYDAKTTKVKWNNPNEIFTEFHLYLGKASTDLSNECLLKSLTPHKILTRTEFVFDGSQTEYGVYKINVLAYAKGKPIEVVIAYEETTVSYVKVQQISSLEAVEIHFDNRYLGYYLKLDDYLYDEEGVLMLTFDLDVADALAAQLLFAAKVVIIGLDEDITGHIPQSQGDSEFKFSIDNKRYARIYFSNRKQNEDPNKRNVLVIALKFVNVESITAKIRVVKVITPAIEVDTKPILRQSADVKENVPYLFKFKRTKPNRNMFLFSEFSVFLYKGRIVNSQGDVNEKEKIRIKLFTEESAQEYVAEYYGISQKVNFQFESIDAIATVIKGDNIAMRHSHHCIRAFFGKSEYVVSSFDGVTDYAQYLLYSNQQYGFVPLYYWNEMVIQGEEKSLLPTTPFPGISELKEPHFLMKLDCTYPGEGYIQLLKPSQGIVLEDDGKSTVHVLSKNKQHTVTLKNLLNRNIEVSLIQRTSSQDSPIVVKVGSQQGTLSRTNRILRLNKVEGTEMTITKQSEFIVLSFKISSTQQYVKVTGKITDQTAQYIYYPLAIDRALYYSYEFDRQITNDITYTLARGDDNFIVAPSTKVWVSQEGNSFQVINPYSTYEETQANDFWYVSIAMPDATPFHMSVKTGDPSAAGIIPSQTLQLLTESRYSLERVKDKSKPSLVIFLAKCEKRESKLKLLYDKVEIVQLEGTALRQVMVHPHYRVPLEVAHSYKSPPVSGAYHLSYNYLSKVDADKAKAVIEAVYSITYLDGILTWTQPNIAIAKARLYLVNETSTEKIGNECEMLASSIGKSVNAAEYSLSSNEIAYGKYRANVLIESKDKLHYAIAYNELSFEYSQNSSLGLWIGISVGIVALIALGVGLGVFYYSKKKAKSQSETLIDPITNLS